MMNVPLWYLLIALNGQTFTVEAAWPSLENCSGFAFHQIYAEKSIPKNAQVSCISEDDRGNWKQVDLKKYWEKSRREHAARNTEQDYRERACERERINRETARFGEWRPTWQDDYKAGKEIPDWLKKCTYGG